MKILVSCCVLLGFVSLGSDALWAQSPEFAFEGDAQALLQKEHPMAADYLVGVLSEAFDHRVISTDHAAELAQQAFLSLEVWIEILAAQEEKVQTSFSIDPRFSARLRGFWKLLQHAVERDLNFDYSSSDLAGDSPEVRREVAVEMLKRLQTLIIHSVAVVAYDSQNSVAELSKLLNAFKASGGKIRGYYEGKSFICPIMLLRLDPSEIPRPSSGGAD